MSADDEYATITWDTNNPNLDDTDPNDSASGLSHENPSLEDIYVGASYSANHNIKDDNGNHNHHDGGGGRGDSGGIGVGVGNDSSSDAPRRGTSSHEGVIQDSFVNGGQSSHYNNGNNNNSGNTSSNNGTLNLIRAHPTASSGIIDDGVFITTSVIDPQKEQEGSQNPYVSYLVKTRSNHTAFSASTFYVRRRFSDFRFLYSRLGSEYVACAIPPLPDRQRMEYIKGDRFGFDFTIKRANSLDRFLKRVAAHPILKQSKVFLAFLESPEWNSYMKTRSNTLSQSNGNNGGAGVTSPLAVVTDQGRSDANNHNHNNNNGSDLKPSHGLSGPESVLDGIQDTLMSAFAKVSIQNPEFVDIKARADKMEENLSRIDKTFSRVATREANIGIDFEDFASQFGLLANLEPALAPEFAHFAKGLHGLADAHSKLKDYLETDFLVSVRDSENYVHSLKSLLKQRDQKQIDHEALVDYLNKAMGDRDALQAGGGGSTNFLRSKVEDIRGLDHEQVKRDKLIRTKAKIVDLTQEVQDAKDTSAAFDELTLKEVSVFEHIRAGELKETLGELAEHHIDFYKGLIDDWEGLIDKLEENVSQNQVAPI